MSPIQITTTSDNKDELATIASRLVDERLAACCQIIGPITSIYRWQDKIEEEAEWMCLIKTTQARFDAVAEFIRQYHHYDEPEIIATPITHGSDGYLNWIDSNTR